MTNRKLDRRCGAVWFLALGLACALPADTGDAGVTTFVLVRHAEKTTGDDPALTAAGAARAGELARVATDLGIAAVYATPYKRTQATARPAAEAAGLEVQTDRIRTADITAYYEEFVAGLLTRHAGERVLIVGHSNTVPVIIGKLGAVGAPELGEKDYDDLFVVTIPPSGDAELLHLHYGVVTP